MRNPHYRSPEPFLAFRDRSVWDVLAKMGERVSESARRISDARLASANEEALAAELASQHELAVPHLDVERMTVDYGSRMVPAEHFPISYGAERGKSYEKKTVIFRIPYQGDPVFLRCHDSRLSVNPPRIFLSEGSVCFEILVLDMDKDKIEEERDHVLRHLREYLPAVARAVRSHNEGLAGRALALLRERKREIQADGELLAALGTPAGPKSAPLPAMSVPPPVRRRLIRVDQSPTQPGRAPDPTLDEKTYGDILEALEGYGTQMERSLSTYSGMGEEDIRNHLLALLQGGFSGSATGESFNRAGKTDILLRHHNRNLFVAECKVWSGPKAYLEAISQLLGYLTWRESKAALLLFVRNKEISKVLSMVRDTTSTHPQFLRLESNGKGTFRYHFSLPADPAAHLHISVLAFHLA